MDIDDPLYNFHLCILEQDFRQYYLNQGGCAKAAYLFYKYLLNKSDIKIKGALALNRASLLNKTSLKSLKVDTEYLIDYCNHVVLVISYKDKQYIVDGVDGVVSKDDYITTNRYGKNTTGYIKPKLLQRLAFNPTGWNEMFDKRNLKYVREFLKEHEWNV